MAQPQWLAYGQASLHYSSKRVFVGILFSLCYALLSASAAVKVSAIQNVKNVARKVVKMFKTNEKKTALLKSCIQSLRHSSRLRGAKRLSGESQSLKLSTKV